MVGMNPPPPLIADMIVPIWPFSAVVIAPSCLTESQNLLLHLHYGVSCSVYILNVSSIHLRYSAGVERHKDSGFSKDMFRSFGLSSIEVGIFLFGTAN